LVKEDLYKIVEIEISYVASRLKDQQIVLELDKNAKELLIEKGFDPVFGARPLKRTIQRYLEDPLAEAIISGQIKEKSHVKVKRKRDSLVF